MNASWYEVWADEGNEVPYLLLLRPTETGFEILDPAQENWKVFETPTYEAACFWLQEDELVRVAKKELAKPASAAPTPITTSAFLTRAC